MDHKSIIAKLDKGEIKLHDLEELYGPQEARLIRSEYISNKSGLDIKDLSQISLDEAQLYRKNIENLIGSVEIPLGIAGPLKIEGDHAQGEYYAPLATTEGALVASTNRGARVTYLSGGIRTVSEFVGVTRAPLLKTTGIKQSREVIVWVREHIDELKGIVLEKENHLKLLKIEPYFLGKKLWLRMYFDSSEAMGMNMATKAADYLTSHICSKFEGLQMTAVSGNMCMDKKANQINALLGRGRRVNAETVIPAELVKKYLKTSVDKIVEVHQGKVWQGSALAGGISFNAHFANIIAAAFAATGQDLAHIVDSSQGYSLFEKQGEDLYVSVSLPSLMLGHVGGGTGLRKQKQARDLMLTDLNSKKLPEGNFSAVLAEVIAAAVLCGEISLHAALSVDDHVTAHESLGKARP
jgi:hydroxymethylglutaryl-CoA reductase (NADPH)